MSHPPLLSRLALAAVLSAGCLQAVSGHAAPPPPREETTAGPQLLLFPDEPFRAQAPVVGKPRAVKPPKPVLWPWKHAGMEVMLVERHDLPTVSLDLRLPGGSISDPPGQEGRAAVCMALLTDGTAALDKLQLADALGDHGITLQSYAGTDEQGISLAVLSPRLPEALLLLDGVLNQTGPRAEELQRQIARRTAALQAQRGTPSAVAGRVQPVIAYGAGHPRGRLVTPESLAAITPASCAEHWQSLSLQKATLYIAGDLTRKQVDAQLMPLLAPLRKKGMPAPAPRLLQSKTVHNTALSAPTPLAGKLFFVEVPGAEQSVLLIQHAGPSRLAPDYEATALMTAIFSGGFSSRINMNLREKNGWAYGAGGGFRYAREGSMLVLSASVRRDATGPAIAEMFKELALMQGSEPTAAELDRERDGTVLALPARWASAQGTLGNWASLRYFGLPLNWYDKLPERLAKVDAKAVQAAARQHLRAPDAQVIVVGDASVRAQLDALLVDGQPLAGVTLQRLDADAKPVP
jgi:zinc protease